MSERHAGGLRQCHSPPPTARVHTKVQDNTGKQIKKTQIYFFKNNTGLALGNTA